MDQWQKMYDDIRRKPFLDMSALKDAKSVIDGLKEAARNLDLKNKADALKETLLTPQQRLEKTLGQYRDELKAGFLTPDQFTKGAMMARESILGQDPKLGSFFTSGSAESQAARYDARFNAGRQKSGRDWAEQQLKEAEKHTSLLGKLVSQGNNPEEVVDMPTA